MRYYIDYEALVYNFPECNTFEFLGHSFQATTLTPEIEQTILPEKNILMCNYRFMSCVFQYEDGHSSFVTAKPKEALGFDGNNLTDEEIWEKAESLVKEMVDSMERHLIFTTNLHIFFPVVQMRIRSEDGAYNKLCGYTTERPLPHIRWSWVKEKINLERRLQLHIEKTAFDKFRLDKKHSRFALAFDYYIRSFYEFDHSSAFCLLCSALDAITGTGKSGKTKSRLSKYSAVLFCEPLKTGELEVKMAHFYDLRSKFIHGKGSSITPENEVELREYVRKFLRAYHLFWITMDIENEQQLLQKLDEIYADPSLNLKYASAAYAFISLSDVNDTSPENIAGLPMTVKHLLSLIKLAEAVIAKPPQTATDSIANSSAN